ncbi:hypothetical protein VOLCADRAFT_87660 [Volvox carteri f. nagariensis]|uniref:G-patch domain-containing protein n=1 Tax=Volvox carteri f. nagariensis TaxID=3068 RepID=D8TLX1_VOLCA|nr:uncharacterized protein VOLCADRAFT_87660 [Volvox carteri f. nagariensis]EFJ51408.1 hypothetical protein VOLCADRAFT_87660 [Volvox carteri f. nagariensis]|eukprot:XP_002947360.1 hypothetical protein VOLCADRAFT_87660 [Volvox carteri f. nagariensis]
MADGQEQKAALAFTFQKKKHVQKVAVNLEEKKDVGQLISGIEGAKIQVVGGDTSTEVKTYVIPKIENTYKSGVGPKKFTPSYKPPSSDANVDNSEDRFVQAASTVPVITEYGLQLRENKQGDSAQVVEFSNGAGGSTTAAALEARAFRESVVELPDAMDVEAYEAMPVEEFGKAMLRGMGWEEGMGVGRNRQKVDAIEYVRRPERLGLGAQPVALAPDPSKPVKMGEKPQRQDLVLAPDADGRQRNIRKLDEQLVARSTVLPGPQPGKDMRITGGPHAGLACTALEALPRAPEGKPERWRVRLTASQEEVEVLVSELGEKWERGGRSEAAAERQRSREPEGVAVAARVGGGGSSSGRGGGGGGGGERGAAAVSRGELAQEREGERGGGRGSTGRREYDRERDAGRQREREGEWDDGRGDGGSGGGASGKRRRLREDGRQHYEDEDDGDGGRIAKKSRGSDRDPQREEKQYRDERRTNRDEEPYDQGDRRGDYHSSAHNKQIQDVHKHDKKKDKKDKKEKKEKKKNKKDKKEKKDKDKGRSRHWERDQHDDYDGGGGDRGRGREWSRSSSSGDDTEGEEEKAVPQPSSRPTWLFPYIKVRIVDKSVRGGKLYLKKGTVVDVHPGGAADVAVDDTGDVLRLAESSLETVVPRSEGAAVLVVAGRHRGSRGRLLQASTANGAAAESWTRSDSGVWFGVSRGPLWVTLGQVVDWQCREAGDISQGGHTHKHGSCSAN